MPTSDQSAVIPSTAVARGAIALLLALVAALILVSAPASADGVITVDVRIDDEPVSGAFVALVGEAGRYAAVTDEGGRATLADVPDGTYDLRASASGTTVGQVSAVDVQAPSTLAVTVERSGTKFRGLGAYGAHVSSVVPDATSGVFYVSTESIPSVFRTADYGGTWAPVTMGNDDPEQGIDAMAAVRVLATSGFPGEVAAITDNHEGDPADLLRLWFSRDFGVTWRGITATVPMVEGQFWNRKVLLWGHVGDTSVLFTDGPDKQMWYAVMPTDDNPDLEPALVPMDHSFKEHPDDVLTIANGSTAPIIAVAGATGGDVHLYTITQVPDQETAPSLTLAGFAPATAPRFVRLGGPTDGPTVGAESGNAMPRTLLAYSAEGDGSAIMSTYDGEGWKQASSAEFRQQESDEVDPHGSFTGVCGASNEAGAIGSLSPLGSMGTVAMCWVTQEEDRLVVRPVQGINNNTGVAFDAEYDGRDNRVLLSGDGGFGLAKSADADPELNRPRFPSWPTIATSGHGPDSGGITIDGLDAAQVNDTAYGPSAGDIVAATGNSRVLGSTDGGDSWMTILWQPAATQSPAAKGGLSVDWWPGAEAGASWIMAGSGGDGDLLAVLTTTAGVPDGAVLSALPGTDVASLIRREAIHKEASALAGVPGQDLAFVGLRLQDGDRYGGALRRVQLNGLASPAIEAAAFEGITNAVAALAYCPLEGSDPRVAGKLFAALAATTPSGTDGGIAVFENAAGGHVPTTMPLTGNLREVRVHCPSGTVWAGREHTVPPEAPVDWTRENGLVRSTDGGATFEPVRLDIEEPLAWRLRHVTAIAVDPGNPLEVVVVGGGGDIISTADGGATWRMQNDTRSTVAKHFGATVNDMEIPPTPLEAAGGAGLSAAPEPQSALLATGSGLYSAAVWSEPLPASYRLSIPLIRR